MVSKNDITGDDIKSKHNTDEYSSGWDLIWGDRQGKTTSSREPDIELEISNPNKEDLNTQ